MNRLGWLVLVALCGCDQGLGEPGEWVAAADIEAPFTPEMGGLIPYSGASAPLFPVGRGDTIRVVTFNVQMSADVEAVARALSQHPELAAASLFFLQEEESYPNEQRGRAASLARSLGLTYVYAPASERGAGTHGLAILSAFPIEDVEVMKLPLSEVSQPRIALRAHIRVGSQVLPVINVHLGAVLNVSDRVLQLRAAVLDHAEPLLVAGDFNTNPYLWQQGAVPVLPLGAVADTDQAPLLDDYMRAIGFQTPTSELGPTNHMLGIQSRLDSIYAAGLDVVPGAVVREVDVSDHWPMWVDVTLP